MAETQQEKTPILIAGAGGRMGRAIARAALETGSCELIGGFEPVGSPLLGQDLGMLAGLDAIGVLVREAGGALPKDGVIIDFSAPQAAVELAGRAADAGVAVVVGATGFDESQDKAFEEAAKKTAIVKSGNMSLGVNLLAALVEKAASALPDSYDIEIIEAHHRHKVDAPSGTALMIAEAAAAGRGVSLAEKSVRVRDGITGERKSGDIGFAVIRGGGIVGDHSAHFAGSREVITLSHNAIDRTLFAEGALAAAQWVHGKSPKLYDMRDVLGLD